MRGYQPVYVWVADLGAELSCTTLGSPGHSDQHRSARRDLAEYAVRTVVREQNMAGEVEILRCCDVCGGHEHGRPQVVGAPLHISASSSGRQAVVAICDSPVGVDIEILDKTHEPPTNVLTTAEMTTLQGLGHPERWQAFLRLWTAKEAVTKADGRGLLAPLQQLDVSGALRLPCTWVTLEGTRWYTQVVEIPALGVPTGFIALATGAPARIVWRTLEPVSSGAHQ